MHITDTPDEKSVPCTSAKFTKPDPLDDQNRRRTRRAVSTTIYIRLPQSVLQNIVDEERMAQDLADKARTAMKTETDAIGSFAGVSSETIKCQAVRDRETPAYKMAPGFATLSALQSSDADIQIYRRFSNLASRNLAYLQSELVALETEIAHLDDQDRFNALAKPEGWMKTDLSARCWEVLEKNAREGHEERDVLRMSLVRKLRALMAEYQDALVRQSRVLELQKPAARSRNAFAEWFAKNRPLVGASYDLLDSTHARDDLVALRTHQDQDRLTSFLQEYAGFFFRAKRQEGQEWEGITYFPDGAIHVIVSVLSVLITAMLLVGAIVALYFAGSQGLKLGLIALFTTIFAAGVGLLTNAKKAELYAATAAYAAVLVVYVSNDPD